MVPGEDPGREHRPRRRATYARPHGVRHLFAAYDLGKDQLYGHIKKTKNRSKFLEFCRYLRSLHPADVRIAIVCDNYSPHLTTKRCQRVGAWAAANNAEIVYTPTNSSWPNRIEAQFTALPYFALDGTDHPTHKAQGSMFRRYIIWRNKNAADKRLTDLVHRANAARPAPSASVLGRQVRGGGALIAAVRNVIAHRRAASPATGDTQPGEGCWWTSRRSTAVTARIPRIRNQSSSGERPGSTRAKAAK